MLRVLFIFLTFLTIEVKAGGVDPKYDYRDCGSAKNLVGKTYVLCLFISHRNNPWGEEQARKMLSILYEATGWLTEQAASYGKTAEFSIFSLGYNNQTPVYLDKYPDGPFDPLYKTLIDNSMQAAGYASNFDFESWAKNNSDCDNVLVLMMFNTTGRAFAINMDKYCSSYNTKNNLKYRNLEGAALYYYNCYDNYVTEAPVFAHELLHCFGAWDLYDPYNLSEERERYMASYFPKSIMRNTSGGFASLEFDYLTAYLVGLTNKREDWYDYFAPSK
ncbi:MAG: hypothetical protein IKQ46_07530 [Bacteroidales bacterium]|nr:hypothetical protein [Bacteroidales bacterium]